jgi:hypothetical protein
MKFDKIAEILAGMKIRNKIIKVGDKIEAFSENGIITKIDLEKEMVWIEWKDINTPLCYCKSMLERNMII